MLEELDRSLAQADAKGTQINSLLEQAIAARDGGRLTGGADSAAALFARALAVDPASGIAGKGLDDIVVVLAAKARDAVAQQRFDEAQALTAEIETVRAGHATVPALRALVADAKAAAAQTLEALLSRGEEQLRRGALLAPAGENARTSFEEALQRDPQNARARAGLARIGSALLSQVNAAVEARDVDSADRLLRQAELLGAPATELRAARVRAREQRERIEIAAERTQLSPEQATRLQKFLADADAALASGALNEPPGGNAYDLYRAALSIDRNNVRAKAGLDAIAPKARTLFEQALGQDRPSAARPYLDAFVATSNDEASAEVMKLRLGQAYAVEGDRQLSAGQRDAAGRTLARAQRFAPSDPQVLALAAKLAQVP